ncbi:MAG TPA: FecR domain-containing protein [Steroidobacteraceae bacterium]
MSKIHQLPSLSGAEQEAAAWIARLHADDVTPEDRARFEAWRAAHPLHERVFDEMSRSIDEVKRAGRIVRAVSFGAAMNAAADPSNTGERAAGAARRTARPVIAAAAVLAALAIGAILWMQRVGPQTLFQTAIGEHASVELPDGSRLELNSNSVARVEYSEGARTIHLTRGEAFFKVAHEPQRPFWVVAGDSWIRAVGTAFNVDLRPSGVRVIVSEGTVKVGTGRATEPVASDDSPLILTAGQQAELKAGSATVSTAGPLEMKRLAAWRKGRLYFENQRLGSVIEELSRYTTAQITIEDESVRNLAIGGTFQANAQGVEALLEMLEQGFGLHVSRESDERIVIRESGELTR